MMPREALLHSKVNFRFFGHDRVGTVIGMVGQLRDPVIGFRMKTDGTRRMVRRRYRGNVTTLTRGDLKTCLIDPKYFAHALAIIKDEVKFVTSGIETATALKEFDRLTGIEVPGETWVSIDPDGEYQYGKRRRRLSHEEVNGRIHEDDSDVDFVVLTEYEYQTDMGMVTSSSRSIFRTQTFYKHRLRGLQRDYDLLSRQLARFRR